MKAKRRLRFLAPAIALVLVGLVVLIPRRHEQLYKVTVLPLLSVRSTLPEAVNDRGQVAGRADVAVPDRYDLFIWDRDNGMQDLGLAEVRDLDINNAGQIAGTMPDPNGSEQAFLWDPEDGKQTLGTLGGTESFARALNNRGQVVGFSHRVKDRPEAFIWDKTGGMRSLTPDERQYEKATAINDAGHVLGDIRTDLGYDRPRWSPCYWDSTDPPATPTVTDLSPEDNPLRGEGINNNGYVLAITRRRRERMHWFCLWHKNAEIKWLFRKPDSARPVAFNDANQVLYSQYHISLLQRLSRKYFPSYKAHCLWDPKRGKVVLDNQVPRKIGKLLSVADLNNQGCIVGVIRSASQGHELAVLLEPIPERWGK